MAVDALLDIVTPYVRRLCGPIALQDAADATQETLIVMLRHLRQLREPAALFGWVRVIAVREAVRVARQSARSVPMEMVDLPAPGDPSIASDVRDVLDRLSPEHRAVLMLRDLEGLDEQAASEHLGVPVGTVSPGCLEHAAVSVTRGMHSRPAMPDSADTTPEGADDDLADR